MPAERIHSSKRVELRPGMKHPASVISVQDGDIMGEADTILCPYCGTRFRFDPRLTPLDADPPDSFFAAAANPGQGRLPSSEV